MMRFHKATQITRVEADFIIETAQESLNDLLVLSHFADWFDVRRMTKSPSEHFTLRPRALQFGAA
jgi:hypothetical protein